MTLPQLLADRLSLPPKHIAAALALFDEGATLPFIARYRKERTGGLDEVQLRAIAEAQRQWAALEARKATVLEAIASQGQLTPSLRSAIQAAAKRSVVDDLYQPYKKRRASRADQARARGLQPLADRILAQPRSGSPVRDEEALQGARDIVAEHLADAPVLRAALRRLTGQRGIVRAKAKRGADPGDFRDYVDFAEPAARIPSHRYLALCRGESEGALSVSVRPDPATARAEVLRFAGHVPRSPFGPQLALAVDDALKRLMLPAAERAVRTVLKAEADAEAIEVFAKNLKALLLGAPLGPKAVLGIDPGLRTGCKCAMVSATGALIAHETLFLAGRGDRDDANLLALVRRHRPEAIAVGNGTGGREAEAKVREVVKAEGLSIPVVSVSESGASVYSASELAGRELGQVDLTVRGAVSIARRLQDPLSELVKVDPASLGVGQYQHDVDAAALQRRLSEVVESCVNLVGVDVNTASPALLQHVAGLGPALSEAIVARREERGSFRSRQDLLAVPKLGPKTYEQCAGFLRVRGGLHPLDDSAVHPERYAVVQRMARDLGLPVPELIASPAIERIEPQRYLDDEVGLATLRDILAELRKPGRDPREAFRTATFRDDLHSIDDLQPGLVLQGVVTNVTNFGAFVDVGVHQDGLVHVSELADRFVRDPHAVVSAGQVLTVKVLEVDVGRKRVALSVKQVGS